MEADVRLVTREEWGALPAKGSSGPWATGWGDFLVVHYTGISARPDPTTFEQKADYLRGLQAYYQSGNHPGGGPGGFVDVGYNFACWNDDEPAIWELRGFRMRGGANGNATSNSIRPSCLVVSDVGEIPHPAINAKMAWLVQQVRERSTRATGTRGHRDEFGTTCPGDALYGLVTSGAFLPENQPTNNDEDDDMAATLYLLPNGDQVIRGDSTPARRVNGFELAKLTAKYGQAQHLNPADPEHAIVVEWLSREIAGYDRYCGL